MSDEIKRVTWEEFMLHFDALPKAPNGLNRKSDLCGFIFGKLLVVQRLDENYFGIKWRCRCVCGGMRDVWSKNLLRAVVVDCKCREKWRKKKQRQKARKERREAWLLELQRRAKEKAAQRQQRHERNAVFQREEADFRRRRSARREQCRAAARKRWNDYRAKITGEILQKMTRNDRQKAL